MVMRQVTWLNNLYVSKVVSQKRDRIDEIDDCHSCFFGRPLGEKNTIQCVKSFISHLWLCSSPTWPLQRALSARTLDRGNSPIFSFYCLSHKKSCCFSVPPTNPAKKKKNIPFQRGSTSWTKSSEAPFLTALTKPRWTLGWEVMMEVPGSYSSYSSWPGVVSAVVEVNPPSMWLGPRWVVRGES